MIDNFEEWMLIDSPPKAVILYELKEAHDGLTLLLKDVRNSEVILSILFARPLAHRTTQESARALTLYENHSMGSYNITRESEFLRWFNLESQGWYDDYKDIIHYNIASAGTIVDVISAFPPEVKWL